MIPKSDELVAYLSEVLAAIKKLSDITNSRNKTTRIKAIASTLKIIEARVDSSLKYVKSGGYTEFTVALQQQMYTPIIEWLSNEVAP